MRISSKRAIIRASAKSLGTSNSIGRPIHIAKTSDILDHLESAGLIPKTLYDDAGSPSVPSAFEVLERNVNFLAPVNRNRLLGQVIGHDRFKFKEC